MVILFILLLSLLINAYKNITNNYFDNYVDKELKNKKKKILNWNIIRASDWYRILVLTLYAKWWHNNATFYSHWVWVCMPNLLRNINQIKITKSDIAKYKHTYDFSTQTHCIRADQNTRSPFLCVCGGFVCLFKIIPWIPV